jgi:hypothetical protein
MLRWISPTPASPSQKWQSRAEILKSAQASDFDSTLQRLRVELEAVKRAYYARKFDPDQPRVPAGNSDGGQWTSGGGGVVGGQTDVSAARRVQGREAECDAQYKLDSAICRMVRTPLCWEQAMKRRAACISGYPLPPLNF